MKRGVLVLGILGLGEGVGQAQMAIQICPAGQICNCCDPNDMPGVNGNPACFEGATCCANGRWKCNDASGMCWAATRWVQS